jgi:hypothetical protein
MIHHWCPVARRCCAAALVLQLAGCGSIGPTTVPRDRIDYLTSIAESWKQQTLLNVVKLRYGDMPVFLEVGQVIAGYQIQTTVGASVNAGNFTSATVGDFTIGGGATGLETYTDRPTVIYAPLTGVDFLKKLMTPLPPSAVFFVLQSGYSAELILPIALDSINGVRNASRRAMRPEPDPRFTRLAQLLRELQVEAAVESRIERPKDGGEATVLFFGPNEDPAVDAKRREVREILGLEPGLREAVVRYGGRSGKRNEIDMMTRSMLQIMLELATIVEVPETDVSEGRAWPGVVAEQPRPRTGPSEIRVLSGANAPSDAYVAVEYNGRSFWIADTDLQSKFSFAFVMLLFSISDTGVRGSAPVVTVPASP